MNKLFIRLFLAFIIFCVYIFYASVFVSANDPYLIYVSVSGDDSSGTGTLDKPFRTLSKACEIVQPGMTIFIRGGTYNDQYDINGVKGNSDNPIYIKNYPGETPVFDGTGYTYSEPEYLITLSFFENVVIEGLTIRNSPGRGINLRLGNKVTLKKSVIHNIQGKGIGISGDNITVEDNELFDCCMLNEYEALGGGSGWPGGISTWQKGDGIPNTNIVIRNNYIYNTWGEGIIVFATDGCLVEGNIIRETYSVLIYVGTSKNITINGNILIVDSKNYYKRGLPANGIGFATEYYDFKVPEFSVENLTISNNITVNTKRGVSYWHDDNNESINNTYKNVKICNNTFINPMEGPVILSEVDSKHIQPSGCELKNNILEKSGSDIGNLDAWEFSNNNWTESIPDWGYHKNSISKDPLFVNFNANDIPYGYMLSESSPCINAGISVSVKTDFFGNPRNYLHPCIGFYEYGGALPSNEKKPIPTLIPKQVSELSEATPKPANDEYLFIKGPFDNTSVPEDITKYEKAGLDAALKDIAGWKTIENPATEIKENGDGIVFNKGMVAYINDTFHNKLISFIMKTDCTADNTWPTIVLRSQNGALPGWDGNSSYEITFKGEKAVRKNDPDNKGGLIEFIKYLNGEEYKLVYIIPNPYFNGDDSDTEHFIEMGLFNENDNVRFIFRIDGKELINYLDKNNPIFEPGYFGIYSWKSLVTLYPSSHDNYLGQNVNTFISESVATEVNKNNNEKKDKDKNNIMESKGVNGTLITIIIIIVIVIVIAVIITWVVKKQKPKQI